MTPSNDYGAKAHISGIKSGTMYHYGLGSHINLQVNGNEFSGYDYDSGSHFMGTISNKTVQLYDYGTGRYHTYLT